MTNNDDLYRFPKIMSIHFYSLEPYLQTVKVT